MKVFAPAAERSTGANLARTLGQTVLFWVVFIGVTPWLIVRIERELGVPGFTFTGGAIWHAIARPMEERDLAERFGASYDHYRANVRCWFPRLSAYRRP